MLDVDELVLKCRDDLTRDFFEEAVKCYRIGAYQSCIVSVWIAVCYDIFGKIRELAASGDRKAAQYASKIETFQTQIYEGNSQGFLSALKFERDILQISLDLELIDRHAFVDLERLQQDRNRSAHPNFQRYEIPHLYSAEHARLHLRNSVDHLLSQAPVQGKSAIEHLKMLSESDSLPKGKSRLENWLKSTPIQNGTEALVRGYVDYLLYELALKDASRCGNIMEALFTIRPNIAEERFLARLERIWSRATDRELNSYAYIAVRISQTWSALSEIQLDRIKEIIRVGELKDISELLGWANVKGSPFVLDVWNKVKALDISQLREIVNIQKLQGMIAQIAIGRYCKSSHWEEANTIADELLIPTMGWIDSKGIKRIVETAAKKEADLIGSYSFPRVLKSAIEKGIIGKDELSDYLSSWEIEYFKEIAEEAKTWIAPTDEIPF